MSDRESGTRRKTKGLPQMVTVTSTTPKQVTSLNITNKPEMIDALKRWAELKQIEAAAVKAKKEREALEAATIRPALGEAHEMILRGVVVLSESSLRHNTSIDQKALQEAWPEAYEATRKVTDYTFLSVNLPANLK